MTREEVQAVIEALRDRVKTSGEILTNEPDAIDKARYTGRHDAFEEAAQMLTAQLEKSELLCAECGFLLAKHPAEHVYRGTAEQRALGVVP